MSNPTFLSAATPHADSRPCFDRTGDNVVFMRENATTGAASLWIVPATPPSAPAAKLFPSVDASDDNHGTRPDWSWATDDIAFTGAHTPTGGSTREGLFLIDRHGGHLRHVDIDPTQVAPKDISYPSWYPRRSPSRGHRLRREPHRSGRLAEHERSGRRADPLDVDPHRPVEREPDRRSPPVHRRAAALLPERAVDGLPRLHRRPPTSTTRR